MNITFRQRGTSVFKLRYVLGLKGDKGDTGELEIGTVTTGAPGSSASVTNVGTSTDAILDFTIPRGDTGAAATIAVGSVTASAPGSSPSITNVGTSGAAVFNFVLPRGDVGPAGPPVSDGDKGDITVSSTGTVYTIDAGALSADTTGRAKMADGFVVSVKLADDAVTDAKIRDSAALSVIGRSANSTGNPADIAAGTDGHVLRRSGTTLGFGQIATAGITDAAVTLAKLATDAAETSQYTPSGTGAVPTTVRIKLREWMSVADFGVVANNSANDTAAWTLAIAAASASGKRLFFPSGISRVTSLTLPANVVIEGESRSKSILRTTSATADVITLDGSRAGVVNMAIDASVSRTAGSFITATTNCSRIFMRQLDLVAPFVGITLPYPSIAIVAIIDVDIVDTVVTTGRSIDINGGFSVLIDHLVCRLSSYAGSRPLAHINVTHVEDLILANSQLIGAINDLNIAPGNGKAVGLIESHATQFDAASGPAIRIAPTGTGVVNRVVLNSPWVLGTTQDILVTNAGGGTVKTVEVNGPQLIGAGTGVDATGVSQMDVVGAEIGGHSVGVSYSNVAAGKIVGGVIGPHGPYGGNTTGISLTGTTANVYVGGGVNLSGNTTPVTFTASGGGCKIEGAIGYPPTGAAAITVGASPFTYTAGPTPETVFVNSGTVSLIAVNGTGMLQSSGHAVPLGPNDTITVTYSVAPSMVRVRH